MPARRSASALAASASIAIAARRPSSTTKSLPRPCILRNGILPMAASLYGGAGIAVQRPRRPRVTFRPLLRPGAPLLFDHVEKQRISRLHSPPLRRPSQRKALFQILRGKFAIRKTTEWHWFAAPPSLCRGDLFG